MSGGTETVNHKRSWRQRKITAPDFDLIHYSIIKSDILHVGGN